MSPRRVVKVEGYAPPRPRDEIALAAGAAIGVVLFTVIEIWLLEPNGLARRQPRAYVFWHAVLLVLIGSSYYLQRKRTPYTARRYLAALPLLALAVSALAYALNGNDGNTDWVRGSLAAAVGFAILWALVEVLVVVRRRLPDDVRPATAALWAGGLTVIIAVGVWVTVPGGIVRTIASTPSAPVITPTTTTNGSGGVPLTSAATNSAPTNSAPATGSTATTGTTAGASTSK